MNAHRTIPHGLSNTGRVSTTIDPEVSDLLFGEINGSVVENELNHIAEIDRAHLVMLHEANLMDADDAEVLIRRIDDCQRSGFAALLGIPAPRGTFMLYESHLILETGDRIGGMLQAGRSRNDLGATVLRLRLREELADFVEQLLTLQDVLLSKGAGCSGVLLPTYTHYQAAQPTSLGHYLAGVAQALDRDMETFLAIFAELGMCPLGAGAVCGTSFPINPQRTAELLGFDSATTHSIEAVASRDCVLRSLAALALVATTISRLAHDFQLWTTAEFGFFHMPDNMVGISSMMPQKRNVYVLENVKGLCASPLGAFTSASMAQHFTPFSNSIAVGTESAKPLWGAINDMSKALQLMKLVVSSAEPVEENMGLRLEKGQTSATALAEWIVQRFKLPFRQVHHEVGRLVREVMDGNDEDLIAAMGRLHPEWLVGDEPDLGAGAVVSSLAFGGGPSPSHADTVAKQLAENARRHRETLQKRRNQWTSARNMLRERVRGLVKQKSSS